MITAGNIYKVRRPCHFCCLQYYIIKVNPTDVCISLQFLNMIVALNNVAKKRKNEVRINKSVWPAKCMYIRVVRLVYIKNINNSISINLLDKFIVRYYWLHWWNGKSKEATWIWKTPDNGIFIEREKTKGNNKNLESFGSSYSKYCSANQNDQLKY